MVVDVMAPGGLAVGGPGYTDARRVRLMHAGVRHLIASDPLVVKTCDPAERAPHWCADWGEPINQEDLLGTLMTFTRVIFESMTKLGVDLDASDAEAYLHAWNVVGHLLGIRPDLLPIDMASAVELTDAIRRRQYRASEAGRDMAAALLELAESEMHPRLMAHVPRAMIRYLVGGRVAAIVGLPPSGPTGLAFAPLRQLLRTVSLDDQHDRLLRAVTERVNRLLIRGWLEFERGGQRATFSIPTELADRWRLPVSPARRVRRVGRTAPAAVDASGTG
jgi:hypothetical protein